MKFSEARSITLIGVGLGAVVVILAQSTPEQMPMSSQFTPFTASVLVIRQGGDGVEQFRETQTFARRRDGSTVEVRETVNGQPFGNKVIIDWAAKKRVVVDPATESKTSYDLAQPVYQNSKPAPNCGASPLSGRVLGLDVARVAGSHSVGGLDRLIARDEWQAPALNCYPLRSVETNRAAEGSGETVTTEVVSIALGDPKPDLFAIPDAFVERSPSQVFAEASRRNRQECKECSTGTGLVLDRAYYGSKQR